MGWFVRFILIAVAGTAGVKAMEESKVAGSIFFLISLAGIVSVLNMLDIVSIDDWDTIFYITLGVIVFIIDALINLIL